MTVIVNIYNGIIMSYVPLPLIVIWLNNAVFLVMILIRLKTFLLMQKNNEKITEKLKQVKIKLEISYFNLLMSLLLLMTLNRRFNPL